MKDRYVTCDCGVLHNLKDITLFYPSPNLFGWRCMISCDRQPVCRHEVIARGLTKRGAYRKAVKAWGGLELKV